MREIEASQAGAHLSSLLDDVERGQTIVIKRRGRAIARIVPEADVRQRERDQLLEAIMEFRKKMPRLSSEEMVLARRYSREA